MRHMRKAITLRLPTDLADKITADARTSHLPISTYIVTRLARLESDQADADLSAATLSAAALAVAMIDNLIVEMKIDSNPQALADLQKVHLKHHLKNGKAITSQIKGV